MGQMVFRHRGPVCGAGCQERSLGEDRRGGSVGSLPAASGDCVAQAARGTEVAGGALVRGHRAGTGEGADRAEEARRQPAPPGATGAPHCGGADVTVIGGEVCLGPALRGKQARRGAGEHRKPRPQPPLVTRENRATCQASRQSHHFSGSPEDFYRNRLLPRIEEDLDALSVDSASVGADMHAALIHKYLVERTEIFISQQ